MHTSVYVWHSLAPLVRRFCREHGVGFNEVVNRAVSAFLGGCDVEELRLRARLATLLKEETELRRVSVCMLRSGSYLPGYVQRVLREPGRSLSHLPNPQRPLKALNPREERVFRRIATRREQIAQEIAEIQEQLLRDVKPFRLKPDTHRRSWSCRHGKNTEKGGENANAC
ncbi:MAG: hypothetical protein K6T73_06930 [Candidatus Bathyarchaeota archaeon]|nr:hypothetical protein [Candidatus Bathyarchaeota archaeon]